MATGLSIIPLHDRVVIETISEDDMSSGGVFIPDTAKDKPVKGRVLFVGPGARTSDGKIMPPSVKSGDIVVYPKWVGTEIVLRGKKYLILKEGELLFILEE